MATQTYILPPDMVDKLQNAERGDVGQLIYEAVEHLVNTHDLSKGNAIRDVAKLTGRQVNTVSANYYRMHRMKVPSVNGEPIFMDDKFLIDEIHAIQESLSRILDAYTTMRKENEQLTSIRDQLAQVTSVLNG